MVLLLPERKRNRESHIKLGRKERRLENGKAGKGRKKNFRNLTQIRKFISSELSKK